MKTIKNNIDSYFLPKQCNSTIMVTDTSSYVHKEFLYDMQYCS